MNRRQLLRGGFTVAGAGLGYGLGKGIEALLGGSLSAVIKGFYNASHDALTEMTAAAEQRLQKSAEEVRIYVGRTEAEHQHLTAYWDKVGLLNQGDRKELTRILENIDHYTQESDVVERMTRLKDRLTKRLVDFDQTLAQKQPQGLQKFNEWFSKQVKGESRGSRPALEKYRERLGALVQVYDMNKDNKIAMAELMHQTAGYFSQAQDEVLKQVDSLLQDTRITDPDERAFYTGLRDLARDDPSGKRLADYLLNTNNYFTALSASDNIHALQTRLEGTLKDVSTLQQILDEGIRLKNDLRSQSDADLNHLRQRAQELDKFMQQKKQDLEQGGYAINYELFPKLKAVADGFEHVFDSMFATVTGVATLGGAGLSYLIARKLTGDGKVSEKKYKALATENERLRKQQGKD